jgi:AmiR/NasT family two-component response regulator
MKAKLLKPLDGREIGATIELSQEEFKRLKALNAVEAKASPKLANRARGAAPANKAEPASTSNK